MNAYIKSFYSHFWPENGLRQRKETLVHEHTKNALICKLGSWPSALCKCEQLNNEEKSHVHCTLEKCDTEKHIFNYD